MNIVLSDNNNENDESAFHLLNSDGRGLLQLFKHNHGTQFFTTLIIEEERVLLQMEEIEELKEGN